MFFKLGLQYLLLFSVFSNTSHASVSILHPQMWLWLRRVPVRGCWTWRRRSSRRRICWRAWRNSWGSVQPRARSQTLNYSILHMSVFALKGLSLFRVSYESSLALPVFFVSVLNPPPDFCRESWRVLETPNTSCRVFRTRWMRIRPRSSRQLCGCPATNVIPLVQFNMIAF